MPVVISGTNGVSGVDGTASNPSYEGTDSNTGIFFPAADTIAFAEGGTEVMRIDSSGNLGLGVTPSAWSSSYRVQQFGNQGVLSAVTSGTPASQIGLNWYADSGGTARYIGTGNASLYNQFSGQHVWLTAPSGTAGNAINFTQAMTLEAGGNLLVGTTSSTGYGSRLRVQGGIETHGFNQYNIVATASGSDFEWVLRSGARQLFYVNNASVVASLSLTGVWTNASDARYKENIVDSQYGLATVMALQPRAYNLIDQEDKPQIGFIAQEVLEVVPEVVDSVHNSVTEEDRYTLSYGNLVAVLTKAIQEQQAMIEELKAKIAALEAK